MIFVANGVYGAPIGGGEVHGFAMARAAAEAGYSVVFLGGHALGRHLRAQRVPGIWWNTDRTDWALPPGDQARLSGQVRLFAAYVRRCRRSCRLLSTRLQPGDRLYAISDFWFDVVPVVRAPPVPKGLIVQMLAPSWKDLILGRRPDLSAGRCAALHYQLSQAFSFRQFRRCLRKHVFYVHPDMPEVLRRVGFSDRDRVYVSNGVDADGIRSIGAPERSFDVVWIGRLHRQKGLDHLAQTLTELDKTIQGFRAVVIGDVESFLRARLTPEALRAVTFAGVVTGPERFRLMASGRVMLMPSVHESWGVVVAEALACRTPVVAYDLPAYHAVFGDRITRVPCFDRSAFTEEARDMIRRSRAGEPVLDEAWARHFLDQHDWTVLGKRFVAAWKEGNG